MKVLVLGAGATGLYDAYLLRQAGLEVHVMDAARRPGGLLATFDIGDGYRLERFYHHFFTHDAEINWLLDELDLRDHVAFRRSTMGVYRDGQVYPFNGLSDLLLRFKPIGWIGRLRFAVSSAMLAYRRAYADREQDAAMPWFERWAGRPATEAIWRPMMNIKFGAAADQIPLAWMAGRLRQRVRSRQEGTEMLGYLRGSLQVSVDRLTDRLVEMGVVSPGDRST